MSYESYDALVRLILSSATSRQFSTNLLRAWVTLSSFWCNPVIVQSQQAKISDHVSENSSNVLTTNLCSPNQPSATHPHFGQTCLFTNSLKFGTMNCGWSVWGRKGRFVQNGGELPTAAPNEDLDGRMNVWERIFEVLFKGWVLDLGYVRLKLTSKCVPKC